MRLRLALSLALLAGLLGGVATAAPGATLPVLRCPSSYGIAPEGRKPPARVESDVPAAVAPSLAAFWNEGILVVGPRTMRCRGAVGADGSAGITLSAGSALVTTMVLPACQGCIAGLVCPWWPKAIDQLGFGGTLACDRRPRGERVVRLSATAVAYEDPTAPYRTHGAVRYDYDAKLGGFAASATCRLPDSQHALCTAVLNDFLHRFVGFAVR